MTNWNLADIWEICAEVRGHDHAALVNGDDRVTWADFDRRAGGLAKTFLAAGLSDRSKVAQYLYNCNEYLESVFASFKASMVPVNTNYRYADEELVYLFDNSDAEAVVFHGAFCERVSKIRARLPRVRLWLHVDDGTSACPDFATPYEEAARALADEEDTHVGAPGRSGDDLYFLYTGGTTGMPKGVMWRQDDLFSLLNESGFVPVPEEGGLEGLRATVAGLKDSPPVLLPACPLMHGTGAFSAFTCLGLGGRVVTLANRNFDPSHLLDVIGTEKVNVVTIVGDAFARPLAEALDEGQGRFELSSLLAMISSGVMWSEETKKALLRHHPNMMLIDVFSSSEALGMGSSVSAAGAESHTASFKLGPLAKVIDTDGNEVTPGSGEAGRLAIGGRIPLGYYKDEEKSASTFVTIDGKRYSVPGDYATVDADGTLHLLGRGSVVINTGGEKVYPEEVEEAIKTHDAVADAACVGVPDERFGQAICALVQIRPGAKADAASIVAHVKEQIAGYKAPRHVVFVDSVRRTPSGKLDYKALSALAVESVNGA